MPILAATLDRLEQLRAPPAATVELAAGIHGVECQNLQQTVLAYLHEQWHVEGVRCFLLQNGVNWNSMEKFVGSELAAVRHERLNFAWHDPGHDLVAVWQVGSGPDFIATAMAKEPVDGQPLVAYFALGRDGK